MPTKYWMITDRNIVKKRLGPDQALLTFWTSSGGPLVPR